MSVDVENLRNEIFAWDEANSDLDVVTRDGFILEKIFAECPISGRPQNRFFYDDGCFVAHGLVFRRRKSRNDEIAKLAQIDDIKNYESRGYTDRQYQ